MNLKDFHMTMDTLPAIEDAVKKWRRGKRKKALNAFRLRKSIWGEAEAEFMGAADRERRGPGPVACIIVLLAFEHASDFKGKGKRRFQMYNAVSLMPSGDLFAVEWHSTLPSADIPEADHFAVPGRLLAYRAEAGVGALEGDDCDFWMDAMEIWAAAP